MYKLYVSECGKVFKELSAVAVGDRLKTIKKISVKDAIKKYVETCTSQKCSKNQNNEKSYFRKFQEFFDRNKIIDVDGINLEHIEEIKAIFLEEMKPSSCLRRFSVYHHFFEKCIQWGFLSANPMIGLKKLKIKNNPFKKWSKEEFDKFISTTDGEMKKLCMFLWFTGCRPKEALNLKWTDINYEDSVIVFSSLKNSEVSRKFFIEPYTDKLLHSIKPTSHFIFVKDKKQISNDNLYQYVKHRLQKLKLNHLTVYGLRHSFAGRCEDDGVQLSHIQKLLGHADIRTTMRYINPSELEIRNSLKKVTV